MKKRKSSWCPDWNPEHSKKCRYTEDDCIQYCYMQLREDFMALIDANEYIFFDELLERGKSESTDLPINEELVENESYKIIYGGMLVNNYLMNEEEAMNIATKMANYGFIHISKEEAVLCQYSKIEFFPELSQNRNFIPFASCMKMPYNLTDRDSSITLTPVINDKCIWEYMVNRPFLLACRGESVIDGLTVENFAKHINLDAMQAAFNVSDLVTGVDEVE